MRSSWPRSPTDEDEIQRLLTFVVVGAGPTGVEMAGQIAELAHRTLKSRLPPDQHPGGAGDPARRRSAGAASVRSEARRPRAEGPRGARRRGSSSAPWSPTSTSGASSCRTRTAAASRIEAATKVWAAGVQASPLGRTARRAVRRAAGPGRPDRREPRPHPARTPRGLRGRRHDRPRQPARGRPGRDPERQVRRQVHPQPDRGQARRRSRSTTGTRARWPPSPGSAPWR